MDIKALEILLVEDNPADAHMTKRTLRKSKIANNISVVGDGAAALEYLRREGPYREAVRPDLILLDLNLPKLDGRQVLAAIKADPDLGSIPVVVLTTSDLEQDILASYGLHCSCYLTKPPDLLDFQKLVKGVEDFWFTLVKLPRADS